MKEKRTRCGDAEPFFFPFSFGNQVREAAVSIAGFPHSSLLLHILVVVSK